MYHTVYEIGLLPSYGFWHGILFLVLGTGSLVIGARRVRIGAATPYKRWFPIVWGSGAAVLGGLAAVVVFWGHVAALLAYKAGPMETVEGVVHVLREQPAGGHAPGDLIEVGGHRLELDYFVEGPGYRTTIAHGGVLRQGTVARCSVHHGAILRLDISNSN